MKLRAIVKEIFQIALLRLLPFERIFIYHKLDFFFQAERPTDSVGAR